MARLKLRTRDAGAITVRCKTDGTLEMPPSFVVSRNKDKDLAKSEDKLRKVVFTADDKGVLVEIREPAVKKPSKAKDEPKRVRSRLGTKGKLKDFPFGKKLKLSRFDGGVPLFIEGIRSSKSEKDVSYRFRFYSADGEMLSKGKLEGTVVDVKGEIRVGEKEAPKCIRKKSGPGIQFEKNKKVLILSTGTATAKLTPDVNAKVLWSYDGITFTDRRKLTTRFQAGRRFTPMNATPVPEIVLAVSIDGQVIEAHRNLFLTAPRALSTSSKGFKAVGKTPRKVRPRGFLEADGTRFTLFDRKITYTILDQFDKPISSSVFESVEPAIRENIHLSLTSTIPTLQRFIGESLRATREFRGKKSGRFTDRLRASELTKDLIRVTRGGPGCNTFIFHPDIRQKNSVLMQTNGRRNHHVWFVSVLPELAEAEARRVAETLKASGTRNPFTVMVIDTTAALAGPKIKLESVYRVVPAPRR